MQTTQEHILETMCSMLRNLRHRGYDSWGLSQYSVHKHTYTSIRTQRYSGSVLTTTTPIEEMVSSLLSNTLSFAIGHTRYTTRGSHECYSQAQPLVNDDGSIALVHNGQVECDEQIYGTDTMYLLETLEECILNESNLNKAFQRLFLTVNGAYSCIALVSGIGILAFRDPKGTRPLCVARTLKGDILFASESCAFSNCQSDNVFFDIEPGEVVWINEEGDLKLLRPLYTDKMPAMPCLF